ncbi:MAG: hypothetical protein WC592_06425 [Candidatus Omnitrophota bacterium]|nr:hypothetical protein [Candidatus Omnitrophota bacterium]
MRKRKTIRVAASVCMAPVLLSAIVAVTPFAMAQEGVDAPARQEATASAGRADPAKAQVIVAQESSMEKSFKETLSENEKLMSENADLKKAVNKGIAKESLYAARVKELTDRLADLKKELEGTKAALGNERAELLAETEKLKKENERLGKEIALFEKEREKNYYFKKMKAAETENSAIKNKMRSAIPAMEALKRENGKLHYNLGNFYLGKGEYKKAAYEYGRAARCLPGDADLTYNQAVLYDYYLIDPRKAVLSYTVYLKKKPKAKNIDLVKERIEVNRIKIKSSEWSTEKDLER